MTTSEESPEKWWNSRESRGPEWGVAAPRWTRKRKTWAWSSHFAEILIGTSGWMYKDWDSKFYPPDMKNPDKLAYISRHYKTLEVNTSFYHFVRKSSFEKWREESEEWFIFSVKAPRMYTHYKRLKVDDELKTSMQYFFASLEGLGEKLWAVLFQLPANFQEDAERLDTFLSECGKHIENMEQKPDLAFEFRHESWFKEYVYSVLRKHNVALVIANSSRYPYEIKTTANFSYMRFHGPEEMFLGKYNEEQLEKWRDEILKFSKPLERVYIYFNNDLEANAIENSDMLMDLFEKKRE